MADNQNEQRIDIHLVGRRQLRGDELLAALREADRRGILPLEASDRLREMTAAGASVQDTIDEVYAVLERLFPSQ